MRSCVVCELCIGFPILNVCSTLDVHWKNINAWSCLSIPRDDQKRIGINNCHLFTGDTTTRENCQQTIWIHIPQSDCYLFVCIGLEWAIVCSWVGRAYWIITSYGIFFHRVLVSAPHMLFALAVANYADAVKSYIKRRHTWRHMWCDSMGSKVFTDFLLGELCKLPSIKATDGVWQITW